MLSSLLSREVRGPHLLSYSREATGDHRLSSSREAEGGLRGQRVVILSLLLERQGVTVLSFLSREERGLPSSLLLFSFLFFPLLFVVLETLSYLERQGGGHILSYSSLLFSLPRYSREALSLSREKQGVDILSLLLERQGVAILSLI